jgi:hypothetical protein
MDARNLDVLHVEPSGIPIPDGLVGRVRWIHPARAEHESHASAIHHGFVLCFLLDSEEKKPQAHVGANSEMPLAECHEIREEEIGVWTNVVGLKAVGGEDGQKKTPSRGATDRALPKLSSERIRPILAWARWSPP